MDIRSLLNPLIYIGAVVGFSPTALASPLAVDTAEKSQTFEIHLSCPGEADHRIVAVEVIILQATKHEKFDDEMMVDIVGTTGTATVPRRLLGKIEPSRSSFDLTSVKISDEEIRGKISINWANHPNFSIDRRSGVLSMSGEIGTFTGRCRKADPTHRAF